MYITRRLPTAMQVVDIRCTTLNKIFCCIPHSYALLHHIAPSSVVCQSVCQCVTLVSPAKAAETIKLPFAFWTRVGPMNHVLHDV